MPLTWPDPLPVFGSVALRPFRPTDLPLVAELSRDPYLPLIGSIPATFTESARDPYLPLIGSIPATFTESAGLAYLERQHQRLVDGTGYSFAIADRTTDQALGGAGLWLDAQQPELARLGYAVAPSARGRGVASSALAALTEFGWTLPALTRLELLIEPTNVASIRVAERAGYQRDVLLAAHQEIGGVLRDLVRYRSVRTPPRRTP